MKTQSKTILYQVIREPLSLMMCYVIKTRTNKLIVIDGGIDGHGINENVYLLDFLKEVQGTGKPEIAAWFFTHIHRDHVHEFIKAVKNETGKFAVNNIYFNFPERDFMQKYCSDIELKCYDDFVEAFDEFRGENAYKNYLPPSPGDIIDIDGVSIEILQVPDNTPANPVNNSTMIFRMTADGQTVLFLGDSGIEAGVRLVDTYGEKIKSDFVQMAHHGQNGVNKATYERIDAKACLWPTPIWVWDNRDANGIEGKGIYQTTEVRRWMYEDFGVKHHFVSAVSGTQEIMLPYDF